jgi:hypothetical protein
LKKINEESLVGKHEGNWALCRLRCRENGNIKIELQEIGLGDVVRINLAQDREKLWVAVNTAITFGFHKIQVVLD